MASHEMVEIDGRRHDIATLPRSYERSCDVCGKFAQQYELVVFSGKVTLGVEDRQRFLAESHRACLPGIGDVIVGRLPTEPPF